ncbi:MAG TPA: ATP-binding protein, partial [Chitinophagaceae bacterium]
DYVAEIANDAYLPLIGKTSEEFIGKPLFETVPEAKEVIEPVIQYVLTTGNSYLSKAFPLTLNRNGKEEQCYFDFVYEPLKEGEAITGFMAVVHEVTPEVIKLKESEQSEALLLEKVKERTLDLEKHKELVDNILKNSSNGISVTEVIRNDQGEIIDGITILANDAAVQFTGLPRDLYLTKKATELDPDIIHSEYFRTCIRTLETGEPSLIQYYLEPTGRWLELTVSRMDNNHLIHIFTDITPIKESQLKLERMVEDLKRSNQNLEDFAYAASHDLKEPVRKVHFFSERIKEKLSDRMTEEEKRYFERMQFASNRMSNLIDDLLTYSQISVKPKKLETVDLNHLMQLVLSDLDLEIEDKKASIQVKDLFTIQGHHRQLQQAFHNLVSNALKYHKEGTHPEIEISGSKVSGKDTELPLNQEQLNSEYFLVTVRDKGIGFEQKDAERIFNIFTRLHGNNEYKGSGVGLSIVKKVMENHYGFVTAESKPGEGSVFKLYFPVMQAQDSF